MNNPHKKIKYLLNLAFFAKSIFDITIIYFIEYLSKNNV